MASVEMIKMSQAVDINNHKLGRELRSPAFANRSVASLPHNSDPGYGSERIDSEVRPKFSDREHSRAKYQKAASNDAVS